MPDGGVEVTNLMVAARGFEVPLPNVGGKTVAQLPLSDSEMSDLIQGACPRVDPYDVHIVGVAESDGGR